ncbi:MAG: OmpA family protein [Actinomycetota bacterium]|jgi:chemotaxis protein MotB|nr:OmpA family protein [Actinomycetota bacterium]
MSGGVTAPGAVRRRRHHHGEAHGEENGERWLLTYADMITLLLALFVVLFAMSSISVKKFMELRIGLTQAFNPSAISTGGSQGLLQQTSLVPQTSTAASQIGTASGSATAAASAAQLDRIAQQISSALAAKHLSAAASVSYSRRGVIVQVLADKAFFATDSAELGPVGNAVVDTIASVVLHQPNNLVVEGYTDNVPITGGPYTSNWELSAVRAANVANRLNVVDGVAQTRLSAQGYGQTHPIVPNDTAAQRAENRRVDVVILATHAG